MEVREEVRGRERGKGCDGSSDNPKGKGGGGKNGARKSYQKNPMVVVMGK